MSDVRTPPCPECAGEFEPTPVVDRRNFIRVVGGTTAALAAVGSVHAAEEKKSERPAKPAEALIRELFAGLTEEQKSQVLLPYDHGVNPAGKGRPTRLGMYNAAVLGRKIGTIYTKPQQELVGRILRAIAADEAGYRQLTRNGTYDASGSLENCGALLFGAPEQGQKWAWVFTGHHLTVRCDGDFADGTAFGGPIYYGHSPNGYSDKNCFYYQTKQVLGVFDCLSDEQRKKAVVSGNPGEHEGSVRLRPAKEARPGLAYADLSADQRGLVEKVMRDVLSPYRKEDVDEVMGIIKATGGLEKIHLAFYQEGERDGKNPWTFWRLEGPGFVWNYRVLPHVHTYVNISSKA